MQRIELVQILDGTHPTAGRGIALAHQGLIVASALAISVETIAGLGARVYWLLSVFEITVLCVFAAEYILRVVCAPRPLRYVLSFWGVVDLLSCLPLIGALNADWAALRTIRLLRLMRLLKLLHANRALHRLELALERSRGELAIFAFLGFVVLYITAVGIYIFEHEAQPEAFGSIPMSMWWAVVSFTTVGYGDAYPITAGGRIFTSAVLFIGLGVIAVPTAIITSALIHTHLRDEVEKDVEQDLRENIHKEVRREVHKAKRTPARRE